MINYRVLPDGLVFELQVHFCWTWSSKFLFYMLSHTKLIMEENITGLPIYSCKGYWYGSSSTFQVITFCGSYLVLTISSLFTRGAGWVQVGLPEGSWWGARGASGVMAQGVRYSIYLNNWQLTSALFPIGCCRCWRCAGCTEFIWGVL